MVKILLGFIILAIFYSVQGYVSEPRLPNTLFDWGDNRECVHANTTYGNRISEDREAYTGEFYKYESFFFKTSLEVKYPKHESGSDCPISSVNIENLYKKCNCHQEEVEIIGGGLGYGYVTLRITSDRNCPNNHRVTVYTKC